MAHPTGALFRKASARLSGQHGQDSVDEDSVDQNSVDQTSVGREKVQRGNGSVQRQRNRISCVIAAFALCVSAVGLGGPASAAPALDTGGQWGPVEDWPLMAIHAALDKNGNVVTYGTNGDGLQTGRFYYDVWQPNGTATAGHTTLNNTTQTDLFCSLQLNRADNGDMLLFGGDNWTGSGTTNTGNPDINVLTADSTRISSLPGMKRSRWYATGTTLPDGSIYVQGGTGGERQPERWTPENGSALLPLNTAALNYFYPHNFVIPDGRIFGIDTAGRMYFISADLTSVTRAGQIPTGLTGGNSATAVMYQPGKIIHFGGKSRAVYLIDVTTGQAVVNRTADLSSIRHWVTGTLLPDGRVLATGGAAKDSQIRSGDPISTYGVNNSAEIWNPATGQWTVGDEAQVARLYHSTALLLPDGRVLTAGSGSPGPETRTDAEIYSPDYLVTANGGATSRPAITGMARTAVTPGHELNLTVNAPSGVSRVTLVKTGSVTHSFNMEQRFVELPFSKSGNAISAWLPESSAVVTPGYYLLSVIDGNGIPSVSEMVHVVVPKPQTAKTSIDGKVARIYQAYFNRQATNYEYVAARTRLINGQSLVQISNELASSSAFRSTYGSVSNSQFIDLAYNNVLGRTPEPAGKAYWLDQMANGVSRGMVMVAMSESPEFVGQTNSPSPNTPDPTPPVRNVAFEPQIRRLYIGYFDRAPDQEGRDYWTDLRAKGISLERISAEFATSAEFVSTYGNTSNERFIDLVYANVLNRQPDAAGRAYWVDQMENGMTRGVLMVGFTESEEFVRENP